MTMEHAAAQSNTRAYGGSSAAVPRPRLEAELDRLPGGGLGVVVAPAGSGKSVLLEQWRAQDPATRCRLTVSAAHEDPVILGRDLVATIATVLPDFEARVVGPSPVAGPALDETLVSTVLVELETSGREVTLLIDDAQHLQNPLLWSALASLFERLPRNVRFVLASRWDLPLRLGHLRLENRVVELRADELAFRVEESRALIANVAGRSVTESQGAALVARTDGWAAGLQLAAISLQREDDVEGFIRQFAGNERLVADYLTEEVMADLEPELRHFLLRTCVLDWLSVDLCNAVTGNEDGAAMLDLLVRRSLFMIPIDDGRLRYHHLFADLLRYHLHVEDPGGERDLRRRAARWLADNGDVAGAVEQLIAARDAREVTELLERRGQEFFEREESATLSRWLDAARRLDPDPPAAVEVSLLAAQLAAHEAGSASETYRRVRRRVDLSPGDIAAAAALHACLGLYDLPPTEVRRAAAEARDLLATFGDAAVVDFLGVGGRDAVAFLAEGMLALADLFDAELDASARQFVLAGGLPGAQYRVWRPYILGGLGLVRALQGRARDAETLAQSAVDFAQANGTAHHHSLVFAQLALAHVALDQGDRDTVVVRLLDTSLLAQRTGRPSSIGLHRVLHIDRISLLKGPTVALSELDAARRPSPEPPLVVELTQAQELRLLVADDRLVRARRVQPTVGRPLLTPHLVDLELAEGHTGAARARLDAWETSPDDTGAAVRRRLREASVLEAEGRADAALASLHEALSLAEPEGLRRPFLEHTTSMRLLRTEGRRASQVFARSILDVSSTRGAHDRAQRSLVEPLTDRELEVLDYLPTRLSNNEIAAALYVSVNTLKSHLRHVYAKLAVTDRDAAVAKASDLGLL